MHARHDVDPDQLEPAAPGGQVVALHDVNTWGTGADLQVRYGLSRWVSPELSVPVRSVFIDPDFADADGAPVEQGESIHHRKESVVGLGDLRLVGVVPVLTDPEALAITLRLGLSLPTGHVEPDPFALGRAGESHQHIFFGSGTVDPVLGVELAHQIGSVLLTGGGQAQLPMYAGEHDYRQGARVSANLGIHWLLDGWRLGLHPGLYFETASKWGSTAADNSGRLDALGSASVGYTPAAGPAWTLTAGKPFTIRTDGGQFDTTIQAVLSASWRLGEPEAF